MWFPLRSENEDEFEDEFENENENEFEGRVRVPKAIGSSFCK